MNAWWWPIYRSKRVAKIYAYINKYMFVFVWKTVSFIYCCVDNHIQSFYTQNRMQSIKFVFGSAYRFRLQRCVGRWLTSDIRDIPFASYFIPTSPGDTYLKTPKAPHFLLRATCIWSFQFLVLVDDMLFHNRCLTLIKILWHVDPLLRNDRETGNYITAIAK
jgi:hypothetical protein